MQKDCSFNMKTNKNECESIPRSREGDLRPSIWPSPSFCQSIWPSIWPRIWPSILPKLLLSTFIEYKYRPSICLKGMVKNMAKHRVKNMAKHMAKHMAKNFAKYLTKLLSTQGNPDKFSPKSNNPCQEE